MSSVGSVHAEANAIISAARSEMIGSTLYLVGKDAKTGALVPDANSCSMCKRQIINAGISRVIIRNTHDTFTTVFVVEDWVLNDASLQGESGYWIGQSQGEKLRLPQGRRFCMGFGLRGEGLSFCDGAAPGSGSLPPE